MGEIVNLRRARKRKDREREASTAAENRALFGLTKAERTGIEAERKKAESDLDARKLDSADDA